MKSVKINVDDIESSPQQGTPFWISENKKSQPFETSEIGVWEWDVIHNKLSWDKAMYSIFDVSVDKFRGIYDDWLDTIHPDDVKEFTQYILKALNRSNELNMLFRILKKDKSIHYIKAKGIVQRDINRDAIRLIGSSWDITGQKKLENELKSINKRLFVEQAPHSMAMLDADMCYLAVSEKWITDYQLEGIDLIGKSYYDIFPEINETWKSIYQSCLNGAIESCEEFPFIRANGSIQWINWHIRPWYISTNKIGGLLIYTADITTTKKEEQDKRKLERVLDRTNEIARIGAWEFHVETNKLIWSKVTREIHEVPPGYTPQVEEAINFFKEGESRDKIIKAFDEVVKHGKPYDLELELLTAKGNTIWTRAIGQADFVNGKCLQIYGTFQDIDSQKRMQQALQVSESRFRGAFEYSAIGMAIVSVEGQWLQVNEQICKMFGYSERELLATTFQEITHPEDLGSDLSQVNQLLENEIQNYHMEKRYFHRNGRIVWGLLSVSLVRDAENKPLHFISQIEDITQRKQVEASLIKVNQELTAILDSTQVSIISTDIHGIITHFNDGAEKLLGYSASEMIGLQTPAILHDKSEIKARSEKLSVLFNKKVKGFDVLVEYPKLNKHESRQWTYVRKNGSTLPVQLVVTAIRNNTGTITGFLGIATDLTDQVNNQKMLSDSKKSLESLAARLTHRNQQLANFAHITSHNLRAPVSNLNSLLTILNDCDDNEKDLILDKFEKVIDHLSDTLHELMEALKIQEGDDKEIRKVYFKDVVVKVQEMISEKIASSEAKITLDFNEAPWIEYNKNYLESIILNLLSNAIRYRSPNRKPEINIKSINQNECISLLVSDNGLGIDMEKHRHKLFGLHKTFHRNPESKGVGLFLTKTQVESMGGEISAQSRVNEGTTFCINFNMKP